MNYVSTRGQAPALPFDEALLAGLATDGGLYVPEAWPRFSRADIQGLRGLPYAELARRIMTPFLGGCIGDDDFAAMVDDAYGAIGAFGHPAVAPLVQLGAETWLLELFQGPTLSFKDYPLQLVGRLFDHVLARRGQSVTIIGATSGDTGSAAIEACRDREAIDIFMLHPKDRISEVQRCQMTTVLSNNVHNAAIEGTFDDCQDLAKAMFNDAALSRRYNLSAVNSINWARIMAQTVYYFAAAVALGAPDRRLAFAVPTGNFGNVYAAYAARKMGLGVRRLAIGSNANDILTRFMDSGAMETRPVAATLSPAMDIQIASNFERLLFDVYGGRGPGLVKAMERLRRDGRADFGKARWRRIRKVFAGHRLDDAGTTAAMRRIHETTGVVVDPHTAIGIAAGEACRGDEGFGGAPLVCISTAHPAKFPDAVEAATGTRPTLPPRLADLQGRRERCEVLPNDLGAVSDFVARRMAERRTA